MAGHEPGASQGVTSGASHLALSLMGWAAGTVLGVLIAAGAGLAVTGSARQQAAPVRRPGPPTTPRDLLKSHKVGRRRRRRTNASGRLGRFGQKPGCGHLQACFRRPLPHAAWQRWVYAHRPARERSKGTADAVVGRNAAEPTMARFEAQGSSKRPKPGRAARWFPHACGCSLRRRGGKSVGKIF
jgi:hypothetical protein